MLSVYYDQALLTVGWHELLEGRFGSTTTSRQWGTSWGPAEKRANKDSGGFPLCWTVTSFTIPKPVQLQALLKNIQYNLCFCAEVRMSAALAGPEVNTPVRMCRRLMWKLITESCSLKTDKWVMEAICYIKTGMREVVLLLVCVSIRKAHVRPISKLLVCFQKKHSRKSKEKTANELDICSTVRPVLRNFRWFLHFAWHGRLKWLLKNFRPSAILIKWGKKNKEASRRFIRCRNG